MIECNIDGDLLDIRAPSVRKARVLAGVAFLVVGLGMPVFGVLSHTASWLVITLPAGVIMCFAGILLLIIRTHVRIDRKQGLVGLVLTNKEDELRRSRPLPSTGHVAISFVHSGFEVVVRDKTNAPVAPIITLADYGESRQAAEAVAALLRMDIHDQCRGDSTVVQSAHDRRPPLKQTLQRGNGKLPDAPEINRVEVIREGRKMTVGIPPRITALHLSLFVPAFFLFTLAIGFLANGRQLAAATCLALWAVIFCVSLFLHPGLLTVTKQQLAYTRVVIESGRVTINREWPSNKKTESRELQISELRELYFLPSPEWGMRPAIVLVTTGEVVSIADHLTEPEADYACTLMRLGITAA